MGEVPVVLAGVAMTPGEAALLAAEQLAVSGGPKRAVRVSRCRPGGDWIEAGHLIVRCGRFGWCHLGCLAEMAERG